MSYRITCQQRDGRWSARAVREDNGDPFGIERDGATEAEAHDRLRRWLDWQREHAAALDALQQAERAYHRTIAGSAFTAPSEQSATLEWQKESLDAVESARVRLDHVRSEQPD